MDIERELDELYGLPLDAFTRARNELAARLRKDGDREGADAVKAVRKPTQPAWVANQLVRREPQLIRALLAATEKLAGAGGDEARDLLAEQRDALRKLAQTARKLAPGAADRAVETLRAAAIDPAARDVLRAGRLTKEVEASGFPELVAPPSGASSRGRAGDDELADRRRRREEEQRRVRELRDEARALGRAAIEAERAADRASAEADRLQGEAEEARASADAAADALERAEAQLQRPSSGRTRRR